MFSVAADNNLAMAGMAFVAVTAVALMVLFFLYIGRYNRLKLSLQMENAEAKEMRGENESLRSQVNELNKILDKLSIPIWSRNKDLKIKYCNLAYSMLAEKSPGREDSGDLEVDKSVRALAEQAVMQNSPQNQRMRLVVGGQRNTYRFYEIPSGKEGTIGFALDENKQATVEAELKRSMDAQKQLLETSASAIAIYGSDTKLKFFNNAFVNLWKLEEPWLAAEPTYAEVLEVLRERRRLPEQANFLEFKKQSLRMFTELLEPREDFYFLPDEKSLRVIAIPHASGGLLFVYEDMTDRLALERSYNTLVAVQRETLDKLHEGIAVFSESGRLKLSNPLYSKIWDLKEGFFQRNPNLIDILEETKRFYQYSGAWQDFRNEIIGRAINRDVSSQVLDLTDGRFIEFSMVPLPDGDVLIVSNDVTASTMLERTLRERTEALEEADRLKTQFLANVSYELRSPLTSIIGFAEILRHGTFGKLNERQEEYIEDIYESSQHLADLINDILDIATVEAGYMKLNISAINVHSMLSSIVFLVSERIKKGGLLLEFSCPQDLPVLPGDENRIKQALFNIMSNAIKFTAKEGRIILKAEDFDKEYIRIIVEDTGQGIPESEQGRIFSKFQKSSAARLSSGVGLGLSVAKNFIELHGGSIELESVPGVGTKVRCLLPKSDRMAKDE